MKSLVFFLMIFSFSCTAHQQTPTQEKQQSPNPAPTVIRGEVDPDRGPEILRIFGTQLFPGFIDMTEGHSMQNPQQEKTGINQFAKGIMAFVSLIVSEATRRPGKLKLSSLNEESLALAIEQAFTSKEGRESLANWNKSLHKLAKDSTHKTIILAH